MAKPATTPTRISSDIVAQADAVAHLEDRSTTEQINHWTRIGMQVERSNTLASRRVLAVARGSEQFAELGNDERTAAHALIDADISDRAERARLGETAVADGRMSVSIDDDGNLVEIAANATQHLR